MLLQHGVIDAAVLLGLQAAPEDVIAARRSHHDSEDGEHDHDDFASFAVSLPAQADTQALLHRLAPLIAQLGSSPLCNPVPTSHHFCPLLLSTKNYTYDNSI